MTSSISKLRPIDVFKIMEEVSQITETGTYNIAKLGCVTPWGIVKYIHVLVYANGKKDVEVIIPQKVEHMKIEINCIDEDDNQGRMITKIVLPEEEKG